MSLYLLLAGSDPPLTTTMDTKGFSMDIWTAVVVVFVLTFLICLFFYPVLKKHSYKPEEEKGTDKNDAVRTPILCPHCKSDQLAFITEYHKALMFRMIRNIMVAVCLIVALSSLYQCFTDPLTFADSIKYYIIMESVLLGGIVVFQFAITYAESRTHTKVICRACGNVWIHE